MTCNRNSLGRPRRQCSHGNRLLRRFAWVWLWRPIVRYARSNRGTTIRSKIGGTFEARVSARLQGCLLRSIDCYHVISRVRKNALERASVLVVSNAHEFQVMLFRGRTKKFSPHCIIPLFDHNESMRDDAEVAAYDSSGPGNFLSRARARSLQTNGENQIVPMSPARSCDATVR